MQITNSYNSYNSYNCKKPNFTGLNTINGFETALTPRSFNLIKKMSNYIDDTWTQIKKGNVIMSSPSYTVSDKGKVITVKPIYQGLKNAILVEAEDPKYIDRIIIDRVRPRDFKFERSVRTDHGSATVKSFDGLKQRDSKIEETVNEYIENSFSKILHLDDFPITKRSLGIE